MVMKYFIGVDVGTGSARAGLFTEQGQMVAMATKKTMMWNPETNYYEQSSQDIWESVCHCVRDCLRQSNVPASEVVGVGFDATCSLVVLDKSYQPLTVSRSGNNEQNIIVWMDHRAVEETEFINEVSNSVVFDFVGGKISPEMQTPKLLWLKKNLPETWDRAHHFFDLPDFLTFRATGRLTRSLCSTVCKWTYLAHEKKGWQKDFFEAIGLNSFSDEDFIKIGQEVKPVGFPLEGGLSSHAASELGLVEGTAVGTSLIDAHAGGIGMLGLSVPGEASIGFNKRLGLITGTSSCHMAVSKEMRKIGGVWGPYFSAMVPDMWLNEGGQSATGSLVDHIVFNHSAYPELVRLSEEAGLSVYAYLNTWVEKKASVTTENLHICPYFHGNRSPLANPHLRGMISGLSLSAGVDDLAALYLATMEAIAFGTRHIISVMNKAGYAIDTIVACGGGTKNELLLQLHATITGCRVLLPKEPEAVLLGASMLGACAYKQDSSLLDVMQEMSSSGRTIYPLSERQEFYDKKYQVFREMYQDQMKYSAMMKK